MACVTSPTKFALTYALLLSALASFQFVVGCYTSIFSFGASFSDTGNTIALYIKGYEHPDIFPSCGLLPNGETFFHHPTGRCSDGRLIIDFIAEQYELPYIPSYLEGEKVNLGSGVNFAVAGSPALDVAFHEQRGTQYRNNISMITQINWFKNLLPSICKASSCNEMLRRSLIVFGPFGDNDYAPLIEKKNIEDAHHIQPLVVNAVASAIEELIELGAVNFMVPGMPAVGCLAIVLTVFYGSKEEDYDRRTGCLTLMNKFAENHNELLQKELVRIRERHPNIFVTYADYYNAALDLYHFPKKYGFNETLQACCGGGGPYNFDEAIECGDPPSHVCVDPSSYIVWDGIHYTEAANRWISKGLLNGLYTIPNINASCDSANGNSLYSY